MIDTVRVLLELRIENLLLIERAELRLGPGLTAVTGETGAGKTVLAHALDLLLGGKPRAGIVRPGAAEAYVEGVFELPPGLRRRRLSSRTCASALRPTSEGEVVLARRVGAEGRTRAYVGGRSATAADLRELGGRLVAFFGQHEHRRLTVASAQLELLDGFCGADAPRAAATGMAASHARVRERARASWRSCARAVGAARPRPRPAAVRAGGDRGARALGGRGATCCAAERERLRQVDGLRAAAGAGHEAIAPEAGDEAGAAMLLAAGRAAGGRRCPGRTPQLDELIGASARAADRGGGARRRAAALRRGVARRRAGAPARGRGAARRLRPGRAQARRLGAGGPRARRALPRGAPTGWKTPRRRSGRREAALGGGRGGARASWRRG